MAKIEQKPTIVVEATMRLSEVELRALDAIVAYGAKPFLEVFYKYLGETYLRPHEEGIVSLFDTVRTQVPPILHRTNDARMVFTGKRVAIEPPKDG